MHSNGSLEIRSVDSDAAYGRSDAGRYQCIVKVTHAEWQWTYVSRTARLRIATLPRFVAQMNDQVVRVQISP